MTGGGPRSAPGRASRPIDWDAVRRRFGTIDPTGTPANAEDRAAWERAVLERRARDLARPPTSPSVGAMLEVLTFALAGESYGVESRAVIAVFKLTEMALLPGVRAPVRGVAAWRGQLLTIVDLRESLGLEPASLNDLAYVLVIGDRVPIFGMLADSVHDIRSLATAALLSPGAGVTKRPLWRGVTSDALVVLDTAALLSLGGES